MTVAHSITSSARTSSDWRDFEAERLGCLEVDDQFELGRELNGQIGDWGAFEYLVHVGCGATKTVLKINSIANEPARFHVFTVSTNNREPICCCGSGDVCPIQN